MAESTSVRRVTSVMGSEGQLTVPLRIRERLGLKAGDPLEFVIDRDKIVIGRAPADTNPFTEWIGIAPGFKTIEEINAWVADMRGDEDPSR